MLTPYFWIQAINPSRSFIMVLDLGMGKVLSLTLTSCYFQYFHEEHENCFSSLLNIAVSVNKELFTSTVAQIGYVKQVE